MLAPDLDFSRAFEATFTKDPQRRREIALAEGEFGTADLSRIDDATLIDAYKDRHQLLILLLAELLALDDKESLPPQIDEIFDRGNPSTTEEFRSFAIQLKQDVAALRAHLKALAGRSPAVAEKLRDFKAALMKPLEVPTTYVVKPITYYSKARVLRSNETYYRIADYSVIREGSDMKLIGVQFFRLPF